MDVYFWHMPRSNFEAEKKISSVKCDIIHASSHEVQNVSTFNRFSCVQFDTNESKKKKKKLNLDCFGKRKKYSANKFNLLGLGEQKKFEHTRLPIDIQLFHHRHHSDRMKLAFELMVLICLPSNNNQKHNRLSSQLYQCNVVH